jgi:hypothetical protein
MSTDTGSTARSEIAARPVDGPLGIRSRIAATCTGALAIAAAAIVVAPLIGSTHISLARAFDPSIPFTDNVDAQIFFVARLPRVLAGALVGAALASAGVVFQAMLRNPLATPFTLGVSAGSSLGGRLSSPAAKSRATSQPIADRPSAQKRTQAMEIRLTSGAYYGFAIGNQVDARESRVLREKDFLSFFSSGGC